MEIKRGVFKKEAIGQQTKRWSKVRLEQWPVVTLTNSGFCDLGRDLGVEVGLFFFIFLFFGSWFKTVKG